MNPALWAAKTGLDAQQTRLAVTSNNLANVSTSGFKKGRGVFEDLMYQNIRQVGAATSQDTQAPSGLHLGTGVRVVRVLCAEHDFQHRQPGGGRDVEEGAGVVVAAQRLEGLSPRRRFRKSGHDVFDPDPCRLHWPAEQMEQSDRVFNSLRDLHRRFAVVRGFDGVGGRDGEAVVVVGERVLPVREPFGVVVCGERRPACLVHRAE